MTTLSVVIPAYNEEDGIAEIAQRVLAIRSELPEVGVDELELLVVNDVGRHGIDEFSKGPNPNTVIDEAALNRGHRHRFGHFNHADAAEAAHIRNARDLAGR